MSWPQESPAWMARGLCRQIGGDIWYPEQGESNLEAKQICAVCPVRVECLDHAVTFDEVFGIWGGLSAQERRRLKAVAEYPLAGAA